MSLCNLYLKMVIVKVCYKLICLIIPNFTPFKQGDYRSAYFVFYLSDNPKLSLMTSSLSTDYFGDEDEEEINKRGFRLISVFATAFSCF